MLGQSRPHCPGWGPCALPVQVQGATVLGLVDILEELGSLVLQHGISQHLGRVSSVSTWAPGLRGSSQGTFPEWHTHHGQVEDASDRPKLGSLGDEGLGPVQRAGVAGGHQHLHTLAPPLMDLLGLVAWGQWGQENSVLAA